MDKNNMGLHKYIQTRLFIAALGVDFSFDRESGDMKIYLPSSIRIQINEPTPTTNVWRCEAQPPENGTPLWNIPTMATIKNRVKEHDIVVFRNCIMVCNKCTNGDLVLFNAEEGSNDGAFHDDPYSYQAIMPKGIPFMLFDQLMVNTFDTPIGKLTLLDTCLLMCHYMATVGREPMSAYPNFKHRAMTKLTYTHLSESINREKSIMYYNKMYEKCVTMYGNIK